MLNILSLRVDGVQRLHRLFIPSIVNLLAGEREQILDLGWTDIVNTIPPLMISLASRGMAPDHSVRTPSSLKILAAQTKLFL